MVGPMSPPRLAGQQIAGPRIQGPPVGRLLPIQVIPRVRCPNCGSTQVRTIGLNHKGLRYYRCGSYTRDGAEVRVQGCLDAEGRPTTFKVRLV